MNFLVILLGLTINYLWLKDLDRFDDSWFFRFRKRIEESFQDDSVASEDETNSAGLSWLLPILAIYAVPIFILALILWFVAERGFGLPTMFAHLLVLLVAFDRTQPLKLASEFLNRWRAGDMEGCVHYLEAELATYRKVDCQSDEEIAEYFKEQLTYRCFEKMFVMFFWYMLTGPLGVMFNYVSYQLRDSHGDGQSASQVKLVDNIIYVLEWVPLRLLALTFSLAGNFVRCFESIKQSLWQFDPQADSASMLYSYAGCALSGLSAAESSSGESNGADGLDPQQIYRQNEANKIESLQGLLERSQAIWLAVLALITIFGLQSS